ncbi:MAG: class II aldolase/adducin family protein [Negativicutes bacterium]|nr:class II aldolase/adducin family protein [Negativicutes bacterium]
MEDHIRKAKEDFIQAAARAYDCGIQTGNGGNISVRIGQDWMAVKASGTSFGDASFDTIPVTDFDGKMIEGSLKPTRETVLHGSLYKKFPDMKAIVHTHSPYSIAWSFTGKSVPLVTKQAELKLKYPVPVVCVETPDVRPEHIPFIYDLFAKWPDLSAFILQGHGIVSVGKSAVEAEHNAEFVEETAQIAWLQAVGQKIGLIS